MSRAPLGAAEAMAEAVAEFGRYAGVGLPPTARPLPTGAADSGAEAVPRYGQRRDAGGGMMAAASPLYAQPWRTLGGQWAADSGQQTVRQVYRCALSVTLLQ